MKRFTSLILMMAMLVGLLPAAQAEESCQSWKPEMEWNADADKYLYGYKSGNTWVIEPQYDYVNEFGKNGLAVVAKDGKYGVIDTAGAWVLEPAYDDISGASPDGLRWFKQDGRYGVMDASCRQFHPADIEADWMGQFVNGSCVYVLGKKYGLVGTDGKKITGPVYDEIESWFEPADGSRPVRMGELWGILTADGTLRAPIQYEDVEIWSNGYARVRLNGKEGILKSDGSPLTELIFSSVEWGDPASEDDFERYDSLPDGEFALVKRDGAVGAVSLADGKLAYPCAFASRSALVTAVHLKVTDPNQLWETVDRLGQEAGLQVSWYPGEDIIRLYGSDRMLRVKDGKCALSGLDGTLYTDYAFDTVQAPGLDGLFPAAQNGRWGKLDRNGNTAVEFLYDTKDSIGVNARFVSKWGDDSPPYALFTLDGKQVTDYSYWTHSEFVNGYAMVSNGSEPWGYIDAAGVPISEKKYLSISGESHYNRWYSTPFGEDGLAAVRYATYGYNIIDTQGHELLEKPSNERPWRAGFGLWGYVDSETYRMGFVDSTGKIVIEPKYFFMEPPIKGGNGWHYDFDENGLLTVNFDSDTEGGGLLTQTIDITGKVVGEGTSEQYSTPDLYEGLLWTSVSSRGHLGSDGGGWGFEDETGKLAVPHLYDAVGYFDQGYASVRAGNVGLKWPDDIWVENPALTVSGAVYGMLKNPLQKDKVDHWARAEVDAAAQAGYVTENCKAYQTYTITREQFASLAVNYLEKKTGQAITPAPADTFTDTVDEAVLKAYAAGIVQGMGDGLFGPGRPLSREQLATMLWRAMEKVGAGMHIGSLDQYTDAGQISDWAENAVNNLIHHEVMAGTSETTISPKASCTVEQAILLVYRAAGKEYTLPSEQEAWRQAAIGRVTIEGLKIGTPFDQLPPELLSELQFQGETEDFAPLPGKEICKRYTAPGIEIVTSTVLDQVAENWFHENASDEELLELFGTTDKNAARAQVLGREYVEAVILTDDTYHMVSGLKVGDSEERVKERGYSLNGAGRYSEVMYSLGSTYIDLEDGKVVRIETYDSIGRRAGPFYDP